MPQIKYENQQIYQKNNSSALTTDRMAKNNNEAGISHFLDLVRQFIQLANTCQSHPLKYIHEGYGFSLAKTPTSLNELNQITKDCLDMDFKQFEKQLRQHGFSLKHKKVRKDNSSRTKYAFTEPFILNKPPVMIMDDTFSEGSQINQEQQDIDDFPRDQQISQIVRLKQGKNQKSLFERIKAHSEGMLGNAQRQKKSLLQDAASIEVKMFEQDLFSTPLASHRRINSDKNDISQQQNLQSISLIERNHTYRQNYQKCSKLIDNAMIEILNAHRKKKVGQKAQEILGKVIEIYDILSDNIENVNETVRELSKKDDKKQMGFSPNLKPLNEGNDYSK